MRHLIVILLTLHVDTATLPASVKLSLRVVRYNSCTPKSFSSLLIFLERAGVDIPATSAALLNDCASTD